MSMTMPAPYSASSSTGSSNLLPRDLKAAREAYLSGDLEASRAAHENENENDLSTRHFPEQHGGLGSRHIKSIVWGGLDGIITTFSVVAAAVGGKLDRNVVLLMGCANLISDGLSMGFGDYLSSKAENDYIMQERKREQWEMENFPEAEKHEMMQLYYEKGIEHEDAKQLVDIMAKYPSFFVDSMMVQELGLLTPDDGDSPACNGLVTFLSFAIFGSVPLLSYVGNFEASFDINFMLACILTGITLLALGFAKAYFTRQNRFVSSLLMLVNGGLAAVAAWLIGWGISEAVH